MIPIEIGLSVAGCTFLGGLAGLHAVRFLPEAHLTRETQDVVRLGTSMISILASLVLGLLIATAKTASDNTDREIRSYATDLIQLDGSLRDYGAAAGPARRLLRRSTERMAGDIWPRTGESRLDDPEARILLEQVAQAIRALTPTDDGQRWLRDSAQQTVTSLARQRWLLIEQAGPTVRPMVLVVLVSWLVAIFASFGLNAPRNATVLTAFCLCSLAIGGAVFLILEMDSPFTGVLRISNQPMLRALAFMELPV